MSASHSGTEKRRQARKALAAGQLLVVELVDQNNPSRKQNGIILDLSRSGMAVQPFSLLSAGTNVSFRLALPQASCSFAGRGQVAWKREDGRAGVHFLDAPLEDNNSLQHWLDRSSPNVESDSALPLSALTAIPAASEFDTALHLIAYSAMHATGAGGAAIALEDSSGIVCRASVGTAPEIGAQLSRDAGLSGLCLRTGETVSSVDVRSDSRVDPAVAEQLDLRSLAILPIPGGARFAGLLEVFAKLPHAFNAQHLEHLDYLVSVLSLAIQEDVTKAAAAIPAPSISASPRTLGANVSAFPSSKKSEENPATTSGDPAESEQPVAAPSAMAEGREIAEDLETSKPARAWRPLFEITSIAVVALLVFAAVWPTLRNGIRRPQSSTSQSVPQNATAQPGQGRASSAGETIAFDPAEIAQQAGATFKVNVILHGARNVSYVPLQILYDPEKLQVVRVSAGSLLESDGKNLSSLHTKKAEAGKIQITASRPPNATGISGDGAIVTLTLRAKTSGRSRLRVDQTELRDPSSHLTSVNATEAQVNILPNSASEQAKTASKPLEVPPATEPGASPVSSAAPVAAESESAVKDAPRAAPSTEPEPPTEKGELLIEGLRPGTQIKFDGRLGTATAADGKVRVLNLAPGEHHLRLSFNGDQFYDQLITIEPGKTTKIELPIS